VAAAAGSTRKPELAGKRIAVCRSSDSAEPLRQLLLPLGATVLAIPLIRIGPPADPEPLQAAALDLERYDWVVVTSAHAARALHAARSLATVHGGSRWPESVQVAAVGEGTARVLAGLGVPVALKPDQASGAGLARALITRATGGMAGRRVLFPRSNLAARTLPDGLRAAGAAVDEVEAYVTRADDERANELMRRIQGHEVDVVVVPSPSTAEALIAAAGRLRQGIELLATTRLVSIGASTSARLQELGQEPAAQAQRPDAPGILEAIRAVLG
jgi:uroporphyrinogen-III synthase